MIDQEKNAAKYRLGQKLWYNHGLDALEPIAGVIENINTDVSPPVYSLKFTDKYKELFSGNFTGTFVHEDDLYISRKALAREHIKNTQEYISCLKTNVKRWKKTFKV